MMDLIGVTGSIGSGKTIVCKVFGILGIPVFNSDNAARQITETDKEVKEELKRLLGKNIYKGQEPDRKKIAGLIFGDLSLLKKVNGIIHPKVAIRFKKWTKEQQAPYVIQEAAILFESGAYKQMDRIITVTAPEELRLKRILKRKNMTREKAFDIMANQWTDNERIKQSDYCINNDEKHMLVPQVLELHNIFCR